MSENNAAPWQPAYPAKAPEPPQPTLAQLEERLDRAEAAHAAAQRAKETIEARLRDALDELSAAQADIDERIAARRASTPAGKWTEATASEESA